MQSGASNPIADWPREKLEEQVIRSLKHIKQLRKQNDELATAVEQLEGRLDSQARANDFTKPVSFAFDHIGKTLTSMMGRSSSALEIARDLSQIQIAPFDCAESPELLSLRTSLQRVQCELEKSRKEQATVREFAASLQQKVEDGEMSVSRTRRELEATNAVNTGLQNDLDLAQARIHDLSEAVKRLSANSVRLPDLIADSERLRILSVEKDELVERNEALKNDMITLRVANDEANRQNGQLHESLKKLTRVCKEHKDEIECLKLARDDAAGAQGDVELQFAGVRELLALRESEIAAAHAKAHEFEARLNDGRGSVDAEAKVAQMNRMLERSNVMFAEVSERAGRSEGRVRELEKQLHDAKSFGEPFLAVSAPGADFVLCSNGRWREGHSPAKCRTISTSSQDHREDVAVQSSSDNSSCDEYLRSLVLQYFRSESAARRCIEPIIWDVLGLNETDKQEIISGRKNRTSWLSMF